MMRPYGMSERRWKELTGKHDAATTYRESTPRTSTAPADDEDPTLPSQRSCPDPGPLPLPIVPMWRAVLALLLLEAVP